MKNIFLLLILLQISANAQIITRIPSPLDTGLNTNGTDQSMIPIIKKDNYMYCYTSKLIGTVQRYAVVRINLDTDDVYLYSSSILSGSDYFFARPRNFSFYQDDVYFNCGTRLYKLNLVTDNITQIATFCEKFYLFSNYLIYNYNSDNTYVKNLITGTTSELKTNNNNLSIADASEFFEYNNELYFVSNATRIDKFVAPNSTNTLYSAPYQPSTINTWADNGARKINNNLIFVLIENGAIKFVSLNLSTNTINPNFTFNTQATSGYGVRLPFVLDNTIFITNSTQMYTSDGINAPTLTNIPFICSYPIVYNNNAYGIVYTALYGPEVWKTDGTVSGTTILKDINPGTEGISGWSPIIHNNSLFSSKSNVNNPSNWDLNIYTSDGTSNNTIPILPNNYFSAINGVGSPTIGYNNYIYVYAETTTESGLFKIDVSQYNLGQQSFNLINKNKFFPNPSNDIISFNDNQIVVEIYDLVGKLVFRKENINKVDIENLSKGIYIVKSRKINGEDFFTEKLIKK